MILLTPLGRSFTVKLRPSMDPVVIFVPFSLNGAEGSKVFALHSDDPAAVVEAVRGLYGEQATLVMAQDRLVVQADDQVIEQIGNLLTQPGPGEFLCSSKISKLAILWRPM